MQREGEAEDACPSGRRDIVSRSKDKWSEIDSDAFLADVKCSKLEAGMTWEQHLSSGYFGDWDPIIDP